MWTSIQNWWASHKPSAKTFAGVWVFVTILWVTNPEFKDYVYGIYKALPPHVHNFIAGIVIPALVLWNTRRAAATATLELGEGQTGRMVATVDNKPVDKSEPEK